MERGLGIHPLSIRGLHIFRQVGELVGFLLDKLSGVFAIVFSIVLLSLHRDKSSPGLKTAGKYLMDGLMLNRGKDRLEGSKVGSYR